jgi:hypothetical protein
MFGRHQACVSPANIGFNVRSYFVPHGYIRCQFLQLFVHKIIKHSLKVN